MEEITYQEKETLTVYDAQELLYMLLEKLNLKIVRVSDESDIAMRYELVDKDRNEL